MCHPPVAVDREVEQHEDRHEPLTHHQSNMTFHPPWDDLPELLLHHVATKLSSLSEYSAFGRVCRTWSDAASAARPQVMSTHSPLVLCSANEEEEDKQRSSYVYTLYSFRDCRFYSARLGKPSTTPLTLRCIGFSNGYLITVLDSAKRVPLLLNPLTGEQLRFPEAPHPIDTAVLLNLPGKRPVLVSLMSPWCSFQCCEGEPIDSGPLVDGSQQPSQRYKWTVCSGDSRGNAWVWCAAVCRGKPYALAADWQLVELDLLDSSAGFRQVSENPPPDLVPITGSASLVEHDGELYAAVPVTADDQHWADPPKSLGLFRFDFNGNSWVKVSTGLNGASFFISHLLHAGVDASPQSWGGERDCVYYTHFWRGCRKIYRLRVPTGEVDDVSVVPDDIDVVPLPTATPPDGAETKPKDAAVDWSFCVWVFPWLCYS